MRPAAAAGGMESATKRCDSMVVALSSPLKKTNAPAFLTAPLTRQPTAIYVVTT